MIAKAGIRRVQEWMGHADIQTTMKILVPVWYPVWIEPPGQKKTPDFRGFPIAGAHFVPRGDTRVVEEYRLAA